MSNLRILIVGTDHAFAGAVRDVITSQIPESECDTLEPDHVRTRPEAGVVLVDARADTARAAETTDRVRAMGFAGALVLLGAAGGALSERAARNGCAVVAPDRLAHELVPRLAELVAAAELPHADQAMRARRLVAAGEIALKLQHALNNVIAGIMAEAQLMQMDPVSAEHAEALARIVELCRRMVELTRRLDGIGERKSASS
ncbi:MAG TPA: hypothetical protein VJL28_03750 [Gemmatimonadaceae bacterium]|nr:hypothetical protein [Gemmatimonadaceae bacterium]